MGDKERIKELEAQLLEATGRPCVSCGKMFPAETQRTSTPCVKGGDEYEPCLLDMTKTEALAHWVVLAHGLREELRTIKRGVREEGESVFD